MELYNQLTTRLNDLFVTQLAEASQWQNVVGQLDRISASPAGYTWGIQKKHDNLYMTRDSELDWKHSDLKVSPKVDLTTDSRRVYVLTYENSVAQIWSHPVDTPDGEWTKIRTPYGTRSLVATSDHLYAETDTGTFSCAGTCETANWTAPAPVRMSLTGTTTSYTAGGPVGSKPVPNFQQKAIGGLFASSSPKIKLTSASARYAYGVTSDLKAMVNINGDWKPIAGFGGRNITSVSGELDTTAIYATTSVGEVLRCKAPCDDPSDVEVLNTQGHAPDPMDTKQITASAASKQVWTISSAMTPLGNLFTKVDGTGTDILNAARPLEDQRDEVVRDLQDEYRRSQLNISVQDQLEGTADRIHAVRPRMTPDTDPRIARRQIDDSRLTKSLRVVQIALATLFLCLVIYLALPAWLAHGLAFVTVCTGILVAVSFSTVQR